MRKVKQKKLIQLMDVIDKGLEGIACAGQADGKIWDMINEYLSAFQTIEEAVLADFSEDKQKEYGSIAGSITRSFEKMASMLLDGNRAAAETREGIHKIRTELAQLRQKLKKEKDIQYLILFLPYKASMWDSMESIWLAAQKDPRCTAFVAPIPYFDRNPDGSFGKMHYEGDRMPPYVEIVDCTRLSMEELMPDMIYFHNPYDDHNYVTSVHPAFYSKELKKYTDLLIYVFYFIPGVYASAETAAASFLTTGMWNADLIIAQSEIHKALMEANGNAPEKIAVLGNPKFDYILNHVKDCRIPNEWESRLRGRKVFLICNSVGPFLENKNTTEQYDALIGWLIHACHAAVIYRPHPLLEATILSMRPQQYGQYMELIQKYQKYEAFILDTMEDAVPSVCASDGMIGDYSSLCFSYAATGRPVAMSRKRAPSDDFYYAFDYRGIDFIDLSGWTTDGKAPKPLEDFVQGVMSGRDNGKERRMELIRKSVVNLDGTSGEKIHEYAIGRLAKCEQ